MRMLAPAAELQYLALALALALALLVLALPLALLVLVLVLALALGSIWADCLELILVWVPVETEMRMLEPVAELQYPVLVLVLALALPLVQSLPCAANSCR
jgi:hypothetical protein